MLTYLKQSGSPGQEKKRISELISKAIKQMNGISEKCSEELVEEVFPAESILLLLRSLLRVRTNDRYDRSRNVLNGRVADLASDLIELAVTACMQQHRVLFKDTKHLGEPILTQMKMAITMCKDLAYQVELIEQDKIAYESNLLYLFKWNKISQRGKARLARYVYERTEIPIGEIKIQKINDHMIVFDVVDELFPMNGQIKKHGEKSASLDLSNGADVKYSENLVIKEGIDSKYVFGKRMT
jgi:hypothetical protein